MRVEGKLARWEGVSRQATNTRKLRFTSVNEREGPSTLTWAATGRPSILVWPWPRFSGVSFGSFCWWQQLTSSVARRRWVCQLTSLSSMSRTDVVNWSRSVPSFLKRLRKKILNTNEWWAGACVEREGTQGREGEWGDMIRVGQKTEKQTDVADEREWMYTQTNKETIPF